MDVGVIGTETFSLENALLLFDNGSNYNTVDSIQPSTSQSRNGNEIFNQAYDEELLFYNYSNGIMTNHETPDSSQIDSSESPSCYFCSSYSRANASAGFLMDVEYYNDVNNKHNEGNEQVQDEDHDHDHDPVINFPLFLLNTSSITDPDQMIISYDDDLKPTSCFMDGFPDIDVQEQVLIEDRDQDLQQYEAQIPIDKYSERMQYKLITDIAGKDEQNALLGIVKSSLSSPTIDSGVQNVEICPGNQDLTIDGTKFSLPFGSSVLAVTNDTSDAFNNTFDGEVPSLDSLFENDDLIHERDSNELDHHMFDVPFPIHDISGIGNISSSMELEVMAAQVEKMTIPEDELNISIVDENIIPILENEEDSFIPVGSTSSSSQDSLSMRMERRIGYKKNIEEIDFDEPDSKDIEENDFEGFEVEEIKSRNKIASNFAPVIEAHDLDDLIKEYEAAVKRNVELENVAACNEEEEEEENSDTEMNETSKEILTKKVDDVVCVPKNTIEETKKPKQARKKQALSLIERRDKIRLRQMKTHQKIRDSIPIEIIEKIKASGTRSCTKILSEALRRRKLAKRISRRIKKICSQKTKSDINNSIPMKKAEIETLTPSKLPSDHSYCRSPLKMNIKVEKNEISDEISKHVFNKIPDYCQSVIKSEIKMEIKQELPEVVEDAGKKDSGVDSGNVSDSSLFEAEERRKTFSNAGTQVCKKVIKTEEEEDDDVVIIEDDNVYSRLPDYVTDIGNTKPKETTMTIKEESLEVSVKEEIEVQEFEPFTKEPIKKKKLNISEYRMRQKHSEDNSRCNSPCLQFSDNTRVLNVNEDGEEGEIKEEINSNDIPRTDSSPKQSNSQETSNSKEKQNCESPVEKSSSSKGNAKQKEKSNKKHMKGSHTKSTSSSATKNIVIEIDLEKEEEEKEREEKIKAKLGFVGKMPSTSLGHCLLYSKMNSTESDENKKTQPSHTGKSSRRHRYSISRSRSRSLSYSSKSSSRYGKSRSHRKSRRRSSKSRSRGRSRSSSSISLRSISSNSSRSRSRSYSKSYRSKSRSSSRSRSNRKKYRYKRHSRSRDNSHRRSRSRSTLDWGVRSRYESTSSYDESYYAYSSAYYTYMSSDYPAYSKHSKQMETEEERRIIYVGGIKDGTTRAELRDRFEKFGQITDISVHFRERGDNYGFITFKHKEDAYDAMERGNADTSLPWYNLCFGGRRSFCREEYADLDAENDEDYNASSMDYDTLLRTTRQLQR